MQAGLSITLLPIYRNRSLLSLTMTTLISTTDLIADSWKFFCARWKPLLKRASWFILLVIAYTIIVIFASVKGLWALYLLAFVLYVVGAIVAVNYLYLYILQESRTHGSSLASRPALQLVLPSLWIGLLVGIPTYFGSLLLILPGIWIGTALGFAHLFLLEDNARGTAAWRASYHLVRGRWWSTFWRMLAPTVLVGIVIWVLSLFMWFIVSFAIGGAFLSVAVSFREGAVNAPSIAGGTLGLVSAVIALVVGLLLQGALLFIMLCYSMIIRTHLFHALKETQVAPLKHS